MHDADANPSLTAVADGVWTSAEPIRIVGMPLASTMTVLRLPGDALLLHSPVPPTPARRAAIDAIGPVAHLYAPNTFHHLWIGDWAALYPEARVHAPAALRRKRPDLDIDRAHDLEPEPEFDGVVVEHHVDGFRMEETALFHRPSRSLVLTDLVHNVGCPSHWWTRTYTRAMGFYGRVALSRAIRWTAFADRAAARRTLDAILAEPFERILVAHGDPVTDDAHAALAEAFAWLPPDAPDGTSRPARLGSPCG